jgi:hypothetical protein
LIRDMTYIRRFRARAEECVKEERIAQDWLRTTMNRREEVVKRFNRELLDACGLSIGRIVSAPKAWGLEGEVECFAIVGVSDRDPGKAWGHATTVKDKLNLNRLNRQLIEIDRVIDTGRTLQEHDN